MESEMLPDIEHMQNKDKYIFSDLIDYDIELREN